MKRRPVSPFSLAFLDIMFCGFGAVVLLVLILNADTVRARNETFADLRGQVVAGEQAVQLEGVARAGAAERLQALRVERAAAEAEAERLLGEAAGLDAALAALERASAAGRDRAERLGAELRQLDGEHTRLEAEAAAAPAAGDRLVHITGEGDRQYLTGLKMGGKHILVLVDVSASMLDETIVNVVRRRNMDAAQRRAAPKWRRAQATARWLLANLPPAARFQLYLFDTEARAAVQGSQGRWLSAARSGDLEAALGGLAASIPAGGTSLWHAFAVAKELSPRPDNILLITDGLPTQGSRKPSATTVSAEQRLEHFEQAARALPVGVPVNTVLLPMEGDAYAAAAFWKLAVSTAGSFLTPARDWP